MAEHTNAQIDHLITALRSQEQADAHGTLVTVSRQACDEAADLLSALKAENERLRGALRKLTNNVRGLMAFDADIRAIAGNTNVNVLQEHVADARAALGETDS